MTCDREGCCTPGRHCQGKAPWGGTLEQVWKYVTVSLVLSGKGVRDGLAIAEASSGKQQSTSERVGHQSTPSVPLPCTRCGRSGGVIDRSTIHPFAGAAATAFGSPRCHSPAGAWVLSEKQTSCPLRF